MSAAANFNWWMTHRQCYDFAADTWILVDGCRVALGPCESRIELMRMLIRTDVHTTPHHCVLCVGSEKLPATMAWREIGECVVD